MKLKMITLLIMQNLIKLGEFLREPFEFTINLLFLTMIAIIFFIISGLKVYVEYAIAFGIGAATVGISYEIGQLLEKLDKSINDSEEE